MYIPKEKSMYTSSAKSCTGLTLIELILGMSLTILFILLFVHIAGPIQKSVERKMSDAVTLTDLTSTVITLDRMARSSTLVSTTTVSVVQEILDGVLHSNLSGKNISDIQQSTAWLSFSKQNISSAPIENIWAICARVNMSFSCIYIHRDRETGRVQDLKMIPLMNISGTSEIWYGIDSSIGQYHLGIPVQYIVQFGFIPYVFSF